MTDVDLKPLEELFRAEVFSKVIYRTGRMQRKHKHDQNRKNFSVHDAEEFIAAITQHIPRKSFQTIRTYGAYSNMRSEAHSSEPGNAGKSGDRI